MKTNLKVLLLPEVVGGEPGGIAEGLRDLGDSSTVMSKWPHPFGYKSDKLIYPRFGLSRVEVFFRTLLAGLYLFKKWDVIHFTFGSTLFDPGNSMTKVHDLRSFFKRIVQEMWHGLQVLELAILRFRGVTVFFHFQGDDARQGQALLSRYSTSIAHVVEGDYYTVESDAAKIRKIKRFTKWSDGMFAVNPDLLWLLPPFAKFIPYATVDPEQCEPTPPSSNKKLIVFAHAPSHRGVKGTNLIVEAVVALQNKGIKVELDLIEGVSNQEAVDRIRKCDVLIDQLYAGWYGGVAVEAMSLGKPVVCYIREEDLGWINSEMRSAIPILRTSPDSVLQTLGEISDMPKKRLDEVGKQSREYAMTWHNRREVARVIRDSYLTAIKSK